LKPPNGYKKVLLAYQFRYYEGKTFSEALPQARYGPDGLEKP
jgi:hypothetical protein